MKLQSIFESNDLAAVLALMRKLEIYDTDAAKAKKATPAQLSKMLAELRIRWEHYNK
jgi:hypothetical protein